MSNNGILKENPMLHEVPPRENSGRDTIARYQAQFRAAAYECLSLLENNALDRVYCDYQDDFVSRFKLDGKYIYNFYQVKTKSKLNYQWSVNDIYGILQRASKKACPNKIANSFAGNLLLHTIKFNNTCGKLFFLTNVHFDNVVESCLEASSKEDRTNNHYRLLLENFNDAFTPPEQLDDSQIIELIKKLNFESGLTHLNPDDQNFSAIARSTIYKYSEIDLQHHESEEVINNLISLVERKSFSKLISDISEQDLDELAGISLSDMLDILSISQGAYRLLKDRGDEKAIKNASIIQRLLEQAGASERMIEYVSESKVKWDIWYRNKRHTIPEFELNFLQEKLSSIAIEFARGKKSLDEAKEHIDELFNEVDQKGISKTLSKELLLGAFFSAMVRNESQ